MDCMARRIGVTTLLWMTGMLLAPGMAAGDGITWGVSPYLGLHNPSLKQLTGGEFAAPMPGRGRLELQGTGDNIDFDFLIDNTLSAQDWSTNGGVEFQLVFNEKNTLLFGFSVWQSTARSSVITDIPFQGRLTPTSYQRSGDISYFEYSLGWKHKLFQRPRKYNIHSRLLLRELFDIDFKEEFVFAFQGQGGQSFKRVVIIESQATGVLLLELGLGMEYYLYDWLSLGLDAGYGFSLQTYRLGNASRKSDLQPNDNIRFKLPSIQDAGGNIQYLANPAPFDPDPSYEAENYRPLALDFSGWRGLFRINFYF